MPVLKPAVLAGVSALAFAHAAAGATPRACIATSGGAGVAILGDADSAAGAWELHRRAVGAGFRSSVIVEQFPGHYEVALFGFLSRSAAGSVRSEAAAAGFRATTRDNLVSCQDTGGDWEAVFGMTRTRAAASRLLEKIRREGFTDGSSVERDGNYYEAVLDRIGSTKALPGLAQEAYRAGWVISVEPS